MGDALDYFKSEQKQHTDSAIAIIDKASAEGRGLNDEEREQVNSHREQALEFKGKVESAQANAKLEAEMRQLAETIGDDQPAEKVSGQYRSMAEAFVKSDVMAALRKRGADGRFTTPAVEVPRFGRIGAANEGTVFEGQGTNADMIMATRLPGILRPVEAPLAIAELFSSITVKGNTVLLARESVTTNAADIVLERGTKPPSDIQFDTVTVTLEKIATIIKVSTEMLEDEEGMLQYLENRLEFFVEAKEEVELIEDLLAQAGQAADSSDIDGANLFDGILAGSVKVRTEGGLDADAVVLTPLDFAKLSVLKTSQDVYYSGGPYAGNGRRLWGRYDVALSERLGDGNVVVGAFKQGGTIVRKRNGVTIDATNSNEDDFKKNLTAIRAEERMALFLQRPDAFCLVTEAS